MQLILAFVALAFVFSCNSSMYNMGNDQYIFKGIDTGSLKYENIVSFENNLGDPMFVISHKKASNDSCGFKNSEELTRDKQDKIYRLKLIKLDPPVIAKSNLSGTYSIHLYKGETYFWYEDTVRTVVYESPNICGKFIEVVK